MPKQRFTTEEIIHKLREADVLSGQDKTEPARSGLDRFRFGKHSPPL
jgi:hypothetical protein